MTELKGRLDDLLAGVPSYVVRDGLAHASRSAGVRRRRRRVVALSAAAVVALIVAAGAATALPHVLPVAPAHVAVSHEAHGYPTRLAYPYVTRVLPRESGPIVGLLERHGNPLDAGSRPPEWLAVTADGRLWRVPGDQPLGAWPSLSPDGSRLAFFPSSTAPLVIRDLTTGRDTQVRDLTAGDDGKPGGVLSTGQSAVWSPDGSHLAMFADPGDETTPGTAVVDAGDGSLAFQRGLATPVGVDSVGRLWTLDQDIRNNLAREITIGRPDTSERTTLALPSPIDPVDESVARISPDGREVSVLMSADDGLSRVRTFDVDTGALLDTSSWLSGAVRRCPLVVTEEGVVVPVSSSVRRAVLVDDAAAPVVIADGRTDASCTLWSASALAGPAHRDLTGRIFGMWPGWLSWWWRETSMGALLVGLGAGLLWLRRDRRRSRPRATD